jgi:two-component system, chemotaxis family, protein-glutamate methylesterase/glutaminase
MAGNERIAMSKYSFLKPDLVLLDIEMPEMDGLETVRELRRLDARVPIIVFSTLTERGAPATLEALACGATDYVTKPSNTDMAATLQVVSGELIAKIRALCGLPGSHLPAQSTLPPTRPLHLAPRPRFLTPARVIAIGVSTGGPDALARLIPLLPADLPVPVVIAQHMPPMFPTMLAARLAAKSALSVRECRPGELLSPGCAYIAPGDFHMIVHEEGSGVRLQVQQGPKKNFCRPSVDVLFRSVASVYGGRALAAILTGVGQDGLRGCELLHKLGSRIIVQDEASSVVWGMPGFVARAGLADKVLPLNQIGAEIVRATKAQASASL